MMDLAVKVELPMPWDLRLRRRTASRKGVVSACWLRVDLLAERQFQRRHPAARHGHGTMRWRGRHQPGLDRLLPHGQGKLATCSWPARTSSRSPPAKEDGVRGSWVAEGITSCQDGSRALRGRGRHGLHQAGQGTDLLPALEQPGHTAFTSPGRRPADRREKEHHDRRPRQLGVPLRQVHVVMRRGHR